MSEIFGRVARLGFSRRLDHAGLATYAPLILCVVVMIPRLVSAQFGLFDDPSTLLPPERILHGEWSPGEEAGRTAADRPQTSASPKREIPSPPGAAPRPSHRRGGPRRSRPLAGKGTTMTACR